MTSYKDPFIKSWAKLLKTELFPNLLSNVQPIQLNIHVGNGWDWLAKEVSINGTIIVIDITADEMIQCNYNDNGFNCYVNFGDGYKFLEIPYASIESIIIGNPTNWISNPVTTMAMDLDENTINYLNNKYNQNLIEGEVDDKLESVN